MSNYTDGVHNCNLQKNSYSCLPILPPRAGLFARLIRVLSKGRLPTYHHRLTVRYFKSEKSLINERLRLIKATPWFVVHPFSIIVIVRDILIIHTFLLDTVVSNLLTSFDPSPRTAAMFAIFKVLEVTCTLLYACNILISLTIGYPIENSYNIELRPREVLLRYLKTYTVPDVVLCLQVLKIFNLVDRQSFTIDKITMMGRFVRTRSFIGYGRTALTTMYRVPRMYHNAVICALVIIVMQHCLTCYSAALQKLLPEDYVRKRNDTSMYRYFVQIEKFDIVELYPIYYHITLCHFYAAGRGRYGIYTQEECMYYLIVMIFSLFLGTYPLIIVWTHIKSSKKAGMRYDLHMAVLNDYAVRKGLNQRLKFRILNYCRHRFLKKTFNEHGFYDSLSQHLRDEIKVQSCYHIIATNSFFSKIAKPDLGRIIASLRLATFSPGEIIYSYGDTFIDLFLISRGTAALYSLQGDEMYHLKDCDTVGIFSIFAGYYLFTCVAIEYTELFVFPREELNSLLEKYPNLMDQIRVQAQARKEKFARLADCQATYKHAFELSQILETRQLRHEESSGSI